MSAGVHIVPVARLRKPGQVFRCEPYRTTLAADACVKRQDLAAHPPTHADKLRTQKCVGCAVGAKVRARLGGLVREPLAHEGARGHRPGAMAGPLADAAIAEAQSARADVLNTDLFARLGAEPDHLVFDARFERVGAYADPGAAARHCKNAGPGRTWSATAPW